MAADLKIGFCGMGQMGYAMSENMLKAGLAVTVWNRTLAKCEPLKEHGAVVADTAEQLYSQCDIIINMLTNPAVTTQFYKDTVLGSCAGKDVIECATVGPACTQQLSEMVVAAGGRFLEAPVAGHSGQAVAKTIVFLCAGNNQVYERSATAMAAMGKGTTYFGEQVGAASNMKLVVNSMLGTFSSALAEALAVTDKVGLSQQQLMGVLDSHPMGSPFLKMAGGMMMENKHEPPLFMAKHEEKDLGLALAMGREAGQQMPLTEAAKTLYEGVLANGDGDKHMSVVYETLKQ